MRSRVISVYIWIGLLVLLMASTAWPQNSKVLRTGTTSADAKTAENLALPRPLGAENVDRIVAGLSDEQVRRLLIEELRAQARQEAQASAGKPKPTGIAGFIDKVKNLTTLLQTRIEYLRSSGGADLQEASAIYQFLGLGERGTKTVTRVILSVSAVLAAGLLIEWLFVVYTAAARRRITSTNPAKWNAKIGILTVRALLDFAAIVIFIVAALAVFSLFLDRTVGQRDRLRPFSPYVGGNRRHLWHRSRFDRQ